MTAKGRRLLKITPDGLASILQGFKGGPPRYFDVVKDALPADVKVVDFWADPTLAGHIWIGLESSEWLNEDCAAIPEICPILRLVAELGRSVCDRCGGPLHWQTARTLESIETVCGKCALAAQLPPSEPLKRGYEFL